MLLSLCPFIILFPGLVLIHSVCCRVILLARLCLRGSSGILVSFFVSGNIVSASVLRILGKEAHFVYVVYGS